MLSVPSGKKRSKLSPASVVNSARAPGGRCEFAGSIAFGSMVPSQGAATASSSIAASRTPPMRTPPLASRRRSSERAGARGAAGGTATEAGASSRREIEVMAGLSKEGQYRMRGSSSR
ncbi:hypothetical protein D9M72_418100 [compost metagenome]